MKLFRPLFLVIVFSIIACGLVNAQKRNAIWCFGDSALVDFSDVSNIVTGTSTVKSRGSCVSISDLVGNLIMYAFTRAGVNNNTTLLRNNQDSLVQNGDSIVGEGWYRELVLIPYPQSDSLFILFTIGVTGSSQAGLYYSIVDMSLNGGLGEVIQKNVQLENFKAVDCLSAVKHGNGRDWWVIFRRFNSVLSPNNDYYIYLVTSSGIISQPIQNVGLQNSTNSGRISFNSSGENMCFINYKGLIELYDFDRCTGLISNPITISSESSMAPWPAYWSSEFSPSGNILYVSRIAENAADSSKLFQYDLTATNISASKIALWVTPFVTTIAQLKQAPDNKIYIATNFGQVYPYTDSMYNPINMNLSVINSPDNLGLACGLQPFSFNLGGKRCYSGLPNNPDYDMLALAGSPCDTLVGISEPQLTIINPQLHVYYHPQWQTAFINANQLKGTSCKLQVFDVMGNLVFEESTKFNPPYYTKNLNCTLLAKGMYVVTLEAGGKRLVKKFVVE
ncbi:MAG: T9SS type A sorting domain-containing protein [Bacteroidetes bacterium]|nr:T9SS type A sorting domain-containing protein [Bacteroidota bacterium]